MIDFQSFFTEGAYKVSDAELKQIEDIVSRYMIYLGKDALKGLLGSKNPKKVLKDKLDKNGELFLGTIEYTDLADPEKGLQPVYVDVSFSDERSRADYDKDNRKITLYYNVLGNESKSLIRSTILHELLHAKQQYKKKGSEYAYSVRRRTLPNGNPSIRSKRGYYAHPTEFPVHLSVITHGIQQQYQELSEHINDAKEQGNTAQVKFWQKKKDEFMSFLKKFITSGGIISADTHIPKFLEDQSDFISTLYKNRKNPKYKDKFQSLFKAISSIYNQLSDYGQR